MTRTSPFFSHLSTQRRRGGAEHHLTITKRLGLRIRTRAAQLCRLIFTQMSLRCILQACCQQRESKNVKEETVFNRTDAKRAAVFQGTEETKRESITDATPTPTDEPVRRTGSDITETMSSWEIIDEDGQSTSDEMIAQSAQILSSTVFEPDLLSDVMNIMEKHSDDSEFYRVKTDPGPNDSSEPLDRDRPRDSDETIARSSQLRSSTILEPDLLPDLMSIMERHASSESCVAGTDQIDSSGSRRTHASCNEIPTSDPSRWEAELCQMRELGFLDDGRNVTALEYAASAGTGSGAADPAAVLSDAVVLSVGLTRWEAELRRMHELGFMDDGRNVEALEHVELDNPGVALINCLVMEDAVEYLLSD